MKDLAKDVAEDVLGAAKAKDGNTKMLIVEPTPALTPPPRFP